MVKSEDDVLVVCPAILTEDGMQAQHLGATLALYRLVKGQVRPRPSRRGHRPGAAAPPVLSAGPYVRAGGGARRTAASAPERDLRAASPGGPFLCGFGFLSAPNVALPFCP